MPGSGPELPAGIAAFPSRHLSGPRRLLCLLHHLLVPGRNSRRAKGKGTRPAECACLSGAFLEAYLTILADVTLLRN